MTALKNIGFAIINGVLALEVFITAGICLGLYCFGVSFINAARASKRNEEYDFPCGWMNDFKLMIKATFGADDSVFD